MRVVDYRGPHVFTPLGKVVASVTFPAHAVVLPHGFRPSHALSAYGNDGQC